MNRLIYESSVAYKGFLIIPFIFNHVDGHDIYSYKLLAEIGYQSGLHKSENPAGIYGSNIENMIAIAKEHLDKYADFLGSPDAFKLRYTYRNHLMVISQENGKYFYSHYSPESLNNIATPKLFNTEYECISWIKQDLNGLKVRRRMY